MKLIRKLSVLFMVLAAMFLSVASFAAEIEEARDVKDLSRAYEVWKTKGIKFVVRDKQGKFVTWNVGRLESWDTKSKWVVRDPKGRFLTHAFGKVENWKNGQTKLVIRDHKGRLLTHLDIKLTDKSSFAATVVGLRHLKNDKYLAFVQDSLSDILIAELKTDVFVKTRVLVQYLNKYKNDKGAENFKPVLRKIIPVLHFKHTDKPAESKIKTLVDDARSLLAEL